MYSSTLPNREFPNNGLENVRQKRLELWPILFCFLIPASKFVSFNFIGVLTLTDIFLIAIFPILLKNKRAILKNSGLVKLSSLFVIWLIGQFVSDIYNGSESGDYLRGWANISFGFVHFLTLYLLLDSNSRILAFFSGVGFGFLLDFYFNPVELSIAVPWKFGYGWFVNILILVLATIVYGRRKSSQWLVMILLLVGVILNIFMNFRSAAGIFFLTLLYISALRFMPLKKPSWTFGKSILVTVLVLLSALSALTLYGQLAESGALGEMAKEKYLAQTSGQYNLILAGRSEILISSRAILDAPLLGHGSWAKNCDYTSLYHEIIRDAGYFPSEAGEDCLIPTHSHIFGAWVSAGILGALFWIYVLFLAYKCLLSREMTNTRLLPIAVFGVFHLAWDIFFSGFAGDKRFFSAFYIVVIMKLQGSKESSQ